MAVTAFVYGSFLSKALNKEIDIDSDTIKAMLVTSSYIYSAAHDYKNDITNEVTGTGYTAAGVTVTCTAPYTAANSWGVSRANSTAYVVGQVVRPATGNGFVYQALTAGTSGGSIPTYPTTIGGTVTDGGVTWLCVGTGVVSVAMSGTAAWASSTITARGIVFYDSTPATDATRPLICFVDLGADVSSTAAAWTYTPDAAGIVNIPV
jgi:hypothetical protein